MPLASPSSVDGRMVKKLELAVSLGFASNPQHSPPTCLTPPRSLNGIQGGLEHSNDLYNQRVRGCVRSVQGKILIKVTWGQEV